MYMYTSLSLSIYIYIHILRALFTMPRVLIFEVVEILGVRGTPGESVPGRS